MHEVINDLVSRTPLPAAERSTLDPTIRTALAWGAVNHPAPKARPLCLDYLDHVADAAAAAVFVAALADPTVPSSMRQSTLGRDRSRAFCEPRPGAMRVMLAHWLAAGPTMRDNTRVVKRACRSALPPRQGIRPPNRSRR